MRDEIDQLAAADEIINDVALRPHIHRAVAAHGAGRKSVERHQSAPADAAGKTRRLRTEQASANGGMNAVGADNHIRLDVLAVDKACPCRRVAGLDPGAARAEIDDAVGEPAPQHLDQVGAMHRQIGGAELPGVGAPARHA